MSRLISVLSITGLLAVSAIACGPYDPDTDSETSASGECTHPQPQTSPQPAVSPAPTPAKKPNATSMEVELKVKGTGSLSGLDPSDVRCLSPGTSFNGLLSGTGSVDG